VTNLIETDSVELLPEETWASSEDLDKNQKALENRSIAKAMKSYFSGDKQMHTYIDLCYVYDLKRREIAEAMGLEPRDVTNLDRKLRYRIPDSVLLRFIGYRNDW
jgi:DNA-directed RNA polymerase specialized sigma24 family protein